MNHKQHQARVFALQFLYQSELDRIHYFSRNHFEAFCEHFVVPHTLRSSVEHMARGVLSHLIMLDDHIAQKSTKWRVQRMPLVDKIILRMATYELLECPTPTKVILNEAIELAKAYGSENSGRFVNGLLDALVKSFPRKPATAVSDPSSPAAEPMALKKA